MTSGSTKVEDRRRFLFGRSGIEISGHGNTLSSVLEFDGNGGCGCDGNSRLSFACLGPSPMDSSSDRSLATVSKSSSMTLFKPRYTGSIVRPHSPYQDKSRQVSTFTSTDMASSCPNNACSTRTSSHLADWRDSLASIPLPTQSPPKKDVTALNTLESYGIK